MRLAELGLLYALVGLASAGVVLRRGRRGAALDAALVALLWPVLLPTLLGARPRAAPSREGLERTFLEALTALEGSPLQRLLPDPEAVRELARRLGRTRDKLAELEVLLATPEFDEPAAARRLDELSGRAGASARAIAAARMRLANIRRMGLLARRYATELEELGELTAQLRTQVALLRHSDLDATCGDPGQVMGELLGRVEALDHLLEGEGELAA